MCVSYKLHTKRLFNKLDVICLPLVSVVFYDHRYFSCLQLWPFQVPISLFLLVEGKMAWFTNRIQSTIPGVRGLFAADAGRPVLVTVIKYSLLVTIFFVFVFDVTLLACGEEFIDKYISPYKDEVEIRCLKTIWTVFLSINVFASTLGFVGVCLEQVCCVIVFAVYAFFVTFGTFFDTMSKNHFVTLGLVILSIKSLAFGCILRIERLAPEYSPNRKFSTMSVAFRDRVWTSAFIWNTYLLFHFQSMRFLIDVSINKLLDFKFTSWSALTSLSG